MKRSEFHKIWQEAHTSPPPPAEPPPEDHLLVALWQSLQGLQQELRETKEQLESLRKDFDAAVEEEPE